MKDHAHFGLKVSKCLVLLTLIAAALFVGAGPLHAQEVTAAITGQVTDPTGAAVAGAAVTATDTVRGTMWPTETNAGGFYNLPRLPIGTYNLKVEAKGFQTYLQTDIDLPLNYTARINPQLRLGAVTQTVEVTGQAPQLHTDTMQVGTVMNSRTVSEIPLATRNFVVLTLLAPGVTATDPSSFNNGQRTGGGGRPYVNGNRKEGNNFLLSGIDNNLVSDNLTAYQPNVDAISEFNMITNNAPAEFGNFQGGVINVEIKSGTNQFHGDVFEFLRNDKLNAVQWNRNWTTSIPQNLKRPPMRWNMFGGTIGGPIKKDKLFFFFDYQGQRLDNPPGAPSTVTVMTGAERTGDFSTFLTSQAGVTVPKIIYNPCTNMTAPCGTAANPYLPAGAVRQAFPNNQIPIAMIDPVAANLFASSLYPTPLGGTGLLNNQIYNSSGATNTDQFDIRLDAKPTDKSSYFGRFSYSNQHIPGVNTFPLFVNTFNEAPFRGVVFDYTRAVSPTFVNDVRLGFNRVVLHNGGTAKSNATIAQDLGIQGGNERSPGLFGINFNGTVTNLGSSNIGTQQNFITNEYEALDTVILTRGRHVIKTGFQLIRQQINAFYAGNNGRTGYMAYNGQFTGITSGQTCPTGFSCSGLDIADFFLGLPYDLGRGLNTGTWGHRSNVFGAFVQDDWRATDHLTLNLGLRWEDHTPWVEVFNRQSNFAPFTGTQYLAGQGSCPFSNCRALYNSFNADFQPRIGFAWTPAFLGGKTVIRGAYTISSFLEGTGTNLRLTLNPPFNTEFENIYSGLSAPLSTSDQGLTVLQAKDPYKNATIRLWDANDRAANVQQWNFTVEHQLPSQMLFSLGYVGQHGTHLMVPMPYFQRRYVGEQGCTAADAFTVTVTGLPVQVCASPYLAGNPVLANIAQISGTESNGDQRYDALQASLSKRYSQGLQFQLSYTWSKTMTNSIGYYGEGGQAGSNSAYWQNVYNMASEWGRSYFDATHNFVGSYVYQLPFGKGKKYGKTLHPVVNGFLGDWEVAGILTLRTGFPWTIQANDNSGTNSRGAKANCLGPSGGNHGVGLGTTWFDTTAFSQPLAGTFGTCANNTVEGPGLRETDFSVHKDFPVTESKRLEFRADFINLTNTPIFATVASRNVTSSVFGQIQSAVNLPRNIQFALKFYF
ncbi:MAG: carboxypeptidase regulatory-like domain-containing protein [Acidobacteriia bacterium]|nr:carboxypeptidase regulatory-like domain-containing protein [Terriglobia bacterium]